jgi:hypothetical protein
MHEEGRARTIEDVERYAETITDEDLFNASQTEECGIEKFIQDSIPKRQAYYKLGKRHKSEGREPDVSSLPHHNGIVLKYWAEAYHAGYKETPEEAEMRGVFKRVEDNLAMMPTRPMEEKDLYDENDSGS